MQFQLQFQKSDVIIGWTITKFYLKILTDLKFQGIVSSIFDPNASVMFISAMGSCVQEESLFVRIFALVDAFGSVRLEVPVILEQQGSTLNVEVLPFTLGPVGKFAGLVFVLDVIWPRFLRPGVQGQSLVALGGRPEVVGACRIWGKRHLDFPCSVVFLIELGK